MKKLLILLTLCILLSTVSSEGNGITDMIFSSPKYEKEIIVKPLLLNKSDVISLLSGKEINVNSHNFKTEIYDIYLVARIRNTGNKAAWGTLEFNVNGREVKIHVTGLPTNMDKYVDFIVPVDIIPPRSTDKPLDISVIWERLYSK